MHVSYIPGLDIHGHCPNCDSDWDGGDIFEMLRPQDWCKDKSDAELRAHIATSYDTTTGRFSRVISVTTPGEDVAMFFECPDCHAQWHRFPPKKLKRNVAK